ncbi:MAG TPA: RES family NAD+ phosphorylase [Noviherbaspirillum sp.]|nr:RES family NAD+ phosphorylase [Noviherbaspirillum sp.]
MSRSVWRIAADTPEYTADDVSGTGAKRTGGRWNRIGTPMLYSAGNIALACLETFVHLNSGGLPLNRYLVELVIPDELWEKAVRLDLTGRKYIGWDAMPYGKVSLDLGDQWAAEKASVLLIVPSAIVPEEFNVLINPAHPDAAAISAKKIRKWLYDPRMR